MGLRPHPRCRGTIGQPIALGGTNWLNLRFVTVLRRRAGGRRPDIDKDGAWLTELTQGDRLKREMPLAIAEILGRESADSLPMLSCSWNRLGLGPVSRLGSRS